MKKNMFIFGSLLILLLAMSTGLMAADYTVSGAGSNEVNGTYTESGTYGGYAQYVYSSYSLRYDDGMMRWEICEWGMPYYYNMSFGSTPPSSGWDSEMGMDPAPTVTEGTPSPSLTYSSDSFLESSANDGTISNSLTITFTNPESDYFTGSNGTFATSKYSVTNLPSGLTMIITKNSTLVLSVSLTGTVTNSNNVNDISNLQIAFDNTAFTNGSVSAVENSTKSDLIVDFMQEIYVASSGGDYTTILAALAASDDRDIINIAAETFTEVEKLLVTKNVTIQGQGSGVTIVQAHLLEDNAIHRVFEIGEGFTVTIKDMTIRHGKGYGTNTTNYATTVSGAGIFNNNGYLTLINTTVSNNKSYHSGEGTNIGGGIYCYAGHLTMTNCTISNNSTTHSTNSDDKGGGIYLFQGGSTITNCTIKGNSSSIGGAIYYQQSDHIISSCTIANNSATGNGDGIYCWWANLAMKNTIIANNGTDDFYMYSLAYGADEGYNIVKYTNVAANDAAGFNNATTILYNTKHGDAGTSFTSWTKGGDAVGSTLNLSSTLADNNTINRTKTLALTSDSFAIDAGTASGAPTTDQRGAERNGATDIGAYEWWSDDAALPVTLTIFEVSYSKNNAVLNWTTESETDNLGFNLYRSEHENGYENENYIQINLALIDGMGTTSTPTNYSFADEYPNIEGHTYWYWLESVSTSNELELFGPVSIEIPIAGQLPTMTILESNYPNPFNPETTISFNIKENEIGTLEIYNLRGQSIQKERFEAGNHQFRWNAEGLSSGMYFYKLSSPTTNITKKMILMK
jgi:Secretion system C-terminal sorting domain